MTKTDQGRHQKSRRTGTLKLTFPNSPKATPERLTALRMWQRMTNAEREAYGYIFDNYYENLK